MRSLVSRGRTTGAVWSSGWLASEGAHLPPNVRAARLLQQMKERAAKIVAHLSVQDVSGEDGVRRIKAEEMEKSPIIRLLEHKEVDKKRQKFMRLARYPHESLESFINRASIYRHENDQCQNYRWGRSSTWAMSWMRPSSPARTRLW